jgi:hypothetical protein
MTTNRELKTEAADRVTRYLERLAELDDHTPVEPIVDAALEILVAITGARLAYIDAPSATQFSLRAVYPRGDIDAIRWSVPRGIVRTALDECRTINTAGAATDDRFANLGSVRENDIQAVLCTPVKVQGLLGVIYLEGVTAFSEFHRDLVEGLARKLGRRLAWPITPAAHMTMQQATEAFRRWFALEVLERTGWKGTAAAEALGISRSTLYELVGDLRSRRRLKAG